MEIHQQYHCKKYKTKFKIDLIVWKSVNNIHEFEEYVEFKIDLIVWK